MIYISQMSMGHHKIDLEKNSCTIPSSNRTIERNDEEELWSPFSDISSGSGGSSSGLSWTDEAEISITRELQEQFQLFEEALYLEASPNTLPKSLQDEVKIWTEYSPHIRIRGFQAKLHERPENEKSVEDQCDLNFEEVIAIHESPKNSAVINDNISSVGKNGIEKFVENLGVITKFDNDCSKLIEEVEPLINSISAGRNKHYSEKLRNNNESGKHPKVLSRSNSSRSHLRNLSPRKPNIAGSEYTCVLSSRGVRPHNDNLYYGTPSEKVLNRAPRTSLPKVRINRVATFSAKLPENPTMQRSLLAPPVKKNKNNKLLTTDKTVILPPIETLAITPKKPDKRANSAMVRFTKTLPRVRPNTSKKKNIRTASNCGSKETKKANSRSEKIIEESDCNITLEIIGTKSNTSERSSR